MEVRSVAILMVVAAATSSVLSGQRPVEGEPPVVRAERFVKDLELPQKRGDAMHGLWQLGGDAAPALARALRDPRPLVYEAACAVIYEIGAPAAQLRMHIERELKTAKDARKAALDWALHGVANDKIALAKWDGGIVVLDKDGKVIAEHQQMPAIWGVQQLPNGHFLAAELTGGVHEYDANGQKCWSFSGKAQQALRAKRLIDGTTCIVDGQSKILEVDGAGKTLWTYEANTSCATRLLNGHYVAVDCKNNKLLEVDRDGKTVKSWDVPVHCYGIQRLPNGNTLVATRTNNRVIEYDLEGKVVKETTAQRVPNDVLRLPSGTTLIATFNSVTAIDATGKQLWLHETQVIGGLSR